MAQYPVRIVVNILTFYIIIQVTLTFDLLSPVKAYGRLSDCNFNIII